MLTSPVAFLSYAHRDDTYHGGAITKLRDELSGAISVAIGKDFSIFQDRQDISWGEHWPSKLEQGLSGGQFLIAILSPSFFNSDYCRKELSEFLEIERTAGRQDLILPIYYVKTPLLEVQTRCDNDPLAWAISQRQYRDWRELRHLPFSDYKVLRALDSLAEELVDALERSNDQSRSSTVEQPTFTNPFSDHGQTFDGGILEDPATFVDKARSRGMMEQQAPFITTSVSSLPEPGTVFRDIDEPWCPEMVVIPPGTFIMGSPPDELGHGESEEPEHRVRIERPFALGIFLVTFDQFDHFCIETARRKPGDVGQKRGRHPVASVNVEDAEAYLAWLTEQTERPYSLPSEAMWEYCCRAGTTTPYSTGQHITPEQASFFGREQFQELFDSLGVTDEQMAATAKVAKRDANTSEVGSFPANAFRLFDMHGNVWEWCADYRHDTYDGAPLDGSAWLDGGTPGERIVRGGNRKSLFDQSLRSASRHWCSWEIRDDTIGFRCALVFPEN